MLVQQTGPSTFNVITSGPDHNCQLQENRTVNGVVSTETKSCHRNSTMGVSGQTEVSISLRPK
jgi:hypothetical protein